MTKEELKQEAEEYRIYFENELYLFDNTVIFPRDIEEAYIAGAEPREKRIAELEEQIEKVKHYLDYDIPLEFINEATTIIYKMV